MHYRAVLLAVFLCITCFTWCPAARGEPGLFAGSGSQHVAGRVVKITGEKGGLVTKTARKVAAGDEIITSSGKHYRVVSVKKGRARAKLVGRDREYLSLRDNFENSGPVPVAANNWRNRPVGIYHTHSDESYLPTDGKSSIPFDGGIYDVGNVFAQVMKDDGIKVKYYKTPHEPHDDSAYARSRRTAMGLIKNNPVAVFDMHRDGVPDSRFFKEKVGAEQVAQIRLVVGRQNPKMKANLDFARRFMASVNAENPGLIKEIYMAGGNYNQDLLSTALLLEMGTFTNKKELAQDSARLLAGSMSRVLGVAGGKGGIDGSEAGETGWNVVLWLVLITLAAGLVFVFINLGGERSVELTRQYAARVKQLVLRLLQKIKSRSRT